MAFWGVVLKPKKSFTLKFSDFQAPRLHLSQATLATRRSEDRTIIRCKSGDSPFVYVCSLLPGSVETCSLNLFFDDDVTFSVKGTSSVHLAGYFDGVFDGNESGEDVEDDGYSEEEEEEGSDYDSMDDFIVKEDEDLLSDGEDDDDEEWSSDDTDIRVRNTGVTIVELPDDAETTEKSLVPVRRLWKDSKHAEKNGPADVGKATGKEEAQQQENGGDNVLNQCNQASSSEDEDGFRVSRKRKHKEAASEKPSKKEHKEAAREQPSKKESAHLREEISEQATVTEEEHETDADTKGSSKKKKKKKKKSKDSAEDVSKSPTAQANGSTLTSKQSDHGKGDELGKEDLKSVPTSSEMGNNKKGTVRKYPNGLEVENIKMGKPDGKQATPGKKIGMIYTGRLRSNDKIFDSNVGKRPFAFRLGVGEVIKGWDIGVNGMRVGDKRRLVIPPNMGYGSKGVPGIPPNSWLKFDVELVEVK